MNTLPLTPVNGLAANGLKIVCLECHKSTTYGKAVADGWTYDPNGKPFEAYYCSDHRVCSNCGQYVRSGDCLNECHKRGLA